MNPFEKPRIKKIENEEYPVYEEHIYGIVAEAMKEFSNLSRTKKRKILKYKRLPAEAVFIFKKLEANGIDINKAPAEVLKQALRQSFELIDRRDDYDKDLMVKVGQLETLRWRAGEKLNDDASFQKIVATLKDHAVPETPLTKIGQNPKVRFAPKGEYHKKQSLK